MSYDVWKNWFYNLKGRKLHLYKLVTGTGSIISQDGILEPARKNLIYPDETIDDGLRIEYAAEWTDDFFVTTDPALFKHVSDTTIAFASGTPDTITDANSNFVDAGFIAGDKVKVTGSDSNDGTYTIASAGVAAGTLTLSTSALTDTTVAFVNSNPDTITDSNSGFVTAGFEAGMGINVSGSTSNDGNYTIALVAAGTLTLINSDSLTAEAAGASVTIGDVVTEAAGDKINIDVVLAEDTTPDETTYVNLTRRLSLAVVDYLKAMIAEQEKDIKLKEYYMSEFFNKLSDNISNKRGVGVVSPLHPFAVM